MYIGYKLLVYYAKPFRLEGKLIELVELLRAKMCVVPLSCGALWKKDDQIIYECFFELPIEGNALIFIYGDNFYYSLCAFPCAGYLMHMQRFPPSLKYRQAKGDGCLDCC